MFDEVLMRLGAAALLTAIIGVDRELRSKPAGLRTNIVVGVAAAAFTYVGAELFPGGDPTRVSSQIVSGIGFLGGGAIFAAGAEPRGLTTAAALWGAAAVGMAAGLGAYATAGALVGVTVVVLWPLDWMIDRLIATRARQTMLLRVVVSDLGLVRDLQSVVESHGFAHHPVDLEALHDRTKVELRLEGRMPRLAELLDDLGGRDGMIVLTDLARTAA